FDMSVRSQKNEETEEGAKSMSKLSYVTTYEGTSFRIVPYSSVDSSFDIKNYIEDYIIFTNGELTDRAIPLLAKAFADNPDADICYGDEDIATLDAGDILKYGRSVVGTRQDPYFKPEWSPNAFLNRFYFCNIAVIRRSSFREAIMPRDTYGARLIYELLLKHIFRDEKNLRRSVINVGEILLHASDYRNNDIRLEKARDYAKRLKCIEDGNVKISVVIPSRNNPDLLDKCLTSLKESLLEGTEVEITVVDNGSDPDRKILIEEVLTKFGAAYKYNPMEFNFSAQCNAGVALSSHVNILLLNDDITFIQKGTIETMAEELKYSFTGAVGLKLLYPGGTTIQHAGVMNNRIGPVHKLQFCDDKNEYYHGYNRYVQNVSAVTAACMMVRRDDFDKINGFDESLKVAFNDVDFCFRLMEAGYVNVVCNNVSAIHAESVTRGRDDDIKSLARLNVEKEHLYESHGSLRGYDPYFSGYLLADCLDSRIVPASEYEFKRAEENFTKKTVPDLNAPGVREDQCVILSVEYAGGKDEFSFDEGDAETLIIQGFSYVSGTDNACYQKSILLCGETGTFEFPISGCVRNDVALACPDQVNVEKSGFCVNIPKAELASGNYRVGMLMTNRFAREKLYTFSNKYMVVD
ncbi:MAG: glycosyltransferase, partial [Lachnospiraceae bacterium]|nr:glycosyltransferase [Lachnospiraceae bacterium]